MARNYSGEYNNYQGKPDQRRRNDARKAARRKMVASGAVKKGDGKDVHHRNGNPKDNSRNNLAITAIKTNRSFPRTSKARKK